MNESLKELHQKYKNVHLNGAKPKDKTLVEFNRALESVLIIDSPDSHEIFYTLRLPEFIKDYSCIKAETGLPPFTRWWTVQSLSEQTGSKTRLSKSGKFNMINVLLRYKPTVNMSALVFNPTLYKQYAIFQSTATERMSNLADSIKFLESINFEYVRPQY